MNPQTPMMDPPTPPGSYPGSSSSSLQPSTPPLVPLLPRRKRIRSVLMRAGTSKGLFFHLSDLPLARAEWAPLILSAMGSPDPFQRQLDGLGGGTSTQSKVAVVSRSDDVRADVDYLFIQVPIDGKTLDFSGNCGNMASGVGPFAVDEGIVSVKRSDLQEVSVRIRNVNTNRIIRSTFSVQDGVPVEYGVMQLDGISALGSPVRLDFLDPAGSMTGRLLPTDSALERITLPFPPRTYTVSCVDAANPFIFVSAEELGLTGTESIADLSEMTTATMMEIRGVMAVRMGLAKTVQHAVLVGGTPKIAIIGRPSEYITPTGRVISASQIDVWVRPFSMGKPHPSIQMTGAVCVGAASAIPGSLVNLVVAERRRTGPIMIGHGSGIMAIEGKSVVKVDGEVVVESGSVYRTARRLMEGNVLYHCDQDRPVPVDERVDGDDGE